MRNIFTILLNIVCLPAILTYILTALFIYIGLIKFNSDAVLKPKKLFALFDIWLAFCEKTYFTIFGGSLLWFYWLSY